MVHDLDIQVAELGVKLVQILRRQTVRQDIVDIVVSDMAVFVGQCSRVLIVSVRSIAEDLRCYECVRLRLKWHFLRLGDFGTAMAIAIFLAGRSVAMAAVLAEMIKRRRTDDLCGRGRRV